MAHVVNRGEYRRVLRTLCLLVALQSPLVHLLGVDRLPWSNRGAPLWTVLSVRVLRALCLLVALQSPLVHPLGLGQPELD